MKYQAKRAAAVSLIDWAAVGAAAATAVFFLFPRVEFAPLFLWVPAIWLVRRIVVGGFFERTPVDWPLGILAAAIFINCLGEGNIAAGLGKIVGALFGIVVFYTLINLLDSEKFVGWAAAAFLGAGAGVATGGIAGMMLTAKMGWLFKITQRLPKVNWKLPGAEAGFNPNPLGGTLILFLPLGIFLLMEMLGRKRRDGGQLGEPKKSREVKAAGADGGHREAASVVGAGAEFEAIDGEENAGDEYSGSEDKLNRLGRRGKKGRALERGAGLMTVGLGIVSLITGGVVVLTQSAGSWIAFLVGMWVFLIPLKWKTWSFMILIVAVAAVLWLQATNPFTGSIDDATAKGRVTAGFEHKLGQRLPMMTAGMEAIAKHPVRGIGMNKLRTTAPMTYDKAHAHNILIHTAAELGIPALIAYLALLIGGGYMCLEAWTKAPAGWMRAAARGLGAGQLAHFVWGMGDAVVLGSKTNVFFWISLALIAAIYKIGIKSQHLDNAMPKC